MSKRDSDSVSQTDSTHLILRIRVDPFGLLSEASSRAIGHSHYLRDPPPRFFSHNPILTNSKSQRNTFVPPWKKAQSSGPFFGLISPIGHLWNWELRRTQKVSQCCLLSRKLLSALCEEFVALSYCPTRYNYFHANVRKDSRWDREYKIDFREKVARFFSFF